MSRSDGNLILRGALSAVPDGKRIEGKSRKCWRDRVDQDTRELGVQTGWREAEQDRATCIVAAAKGPHFYFFV